MGRLLGWFGRHPLVWGIPLLFWLGLAAFVLLRLAAAPHTEFIYNI